MLTGYLVQWKWLRLGKHLFSLKNAFRYESALKYLIQSLHKDDLSDTLKVHLRAMIFDILNRLRLPILLDPMECPQELSIWTEAEKLSPYPAGFDEEALSKFEFLCFLTFNLFEAD